MKKILGSLARGHTLKLPPRRICLGHDVARNKALSRMSRGVKAGLISFVLALIISAPGFSRGEIQDGLCKVYSGDRFGYLDIVAMHRKGERDGIAMQFFQSGELKKVAWYRQGTLHGTFESFWVNGQPRAILDYDNGILDGRAYYYDYYGKPQVKRMYSQGRLNELGYYYENGVLQKTVEYRNGHAVSIK